LTNYYGDEGEVRVIERFFIKRRDQRLQSLIEEKGGKKTEKK